jgi:glycosyl hydrolase family 99
MPALRLAQVIPTPSQRLHTSFNAGVASVLLAVLLWPAAAAAVPRVMMTPASGPGGTRVVIAGAGFPRGAAARVAGQRLTIDARGAFRRVAHVPALAHGRYAFVTRTRGARLRSVFRVGAPGATGEAVSAGGPRVYWRARAKSLSLAGSGFGARRPVTVRAAGKLRHLRSSRRGTFALRLAVTRGRAVVSSRRGRLSFRFAALIASRQPRFPIRAAFYYPWFPEAWSERGIDPFTHYHPTAGPYSSSDSAVLRSQIGQMRYAGVDAGISSWWGQGTRTDRRVPGLLAAAHGTPFRWALYYEPEGHGDPSPAAIRADLSYIRTRYANDPAYLRVDGRFVVFVYARKGDGAGMAERWRKANDLDAYVVLKVFPGYRDVAAQPDGWHQYAPALAESEQAGHSFSVSPGFWHAADAQPRLERDVGRFAASVRTMVASRAPWQLVTTFNEWGEGTAVEPASEWASHSGYGAYLDALARDGR